MRQSRAAPAGSAETIPGELTHTLAGQSHRADGGSQLESEEISSCVQPKLLTHGLVSEPNAYCFKPLQFQTAVCFAEVMDNGGSHLL